ncbi:MAG: chorismate synthase [Syntrophales bacterium]|nr:chorismate synthase [Syntrophales bacterium]
MAGNTIGQLFKVTTWGESHGTALGVVVDGCPPRIPISRDEIQEELERRKPGTGDGTSPRRESDTVEILSGVFQGMTTGTPIAMIIRNVDTDVTPYETMSRIFRPGHGDYTYWKKYGVRDYRGGGRASGRETVARVAAGAIARKVIGLAGIEVHSYTISLGGVVAREFCPEVARGNVLRCPDEKAAEAMLDVLEKCRNQGDTVGGVAEIRVRGCPPGLGEPVFNKLDADLAAALMSIGTVKGVEIGAGFKAAFMRGSECNDAMESGGFCSNHAGGILAGISTGQDIVIRVACKPIPSIRLEQKTVDIEGRPVKIKIEGRHDVCVLPRILPVCEAMVCIVLADHLLRQKALGLVE